MEADPVSAGRPRILSRRVACANKVWNVYFAHVTDGTIEIPDYLVVEPKVRLAGDVTGVAILPVMGGKVGVQTIGRVAMDAVFVEAPKGFVDPGEDALGAALRELAEETRLVCDPADVVALGSVTPEASTLAARIRLFAALRCRPGGSARDAEVGLGELTFVALDRLRVMVAEAEIEDATTAVAIYRLLAKADADPMVRAALMG